MVAFILHLGRGFLRALRSAKSCRFAAWGVTVRREFASRHALLVFCRSDTLIIAAVLHAFIARSFIILQLKEMRLADDAVRTVNRCTATESGAEAHRIHGTLMCGGWGRSVA